MPYVITWRCTSRVWSFLKQSNFDENLRESSLVAERFVYEGIQNEGRVMNANIDKLMLKYVEDYSKAYKKAVDENRKKQTAGERKNEKRHLNNKLKVSKEAKKDAVCVQQTTNNELVGNKAKGRISKRVFQEKKARQISENWHSFIRFR